MSSSKYKASKSILLSQTGSLTLDYLISFVLVSGMSIVIITFSSTLSMVEVVQYMTFAASRKFFSANVDLGSQQSAARRKFDELKANPIVTPLLSGGWFEVPEDSFVADKSVPEKYPQYAGYKDSEQMVSLYHGVAVGFIARVLDFQVPFFGGTKTNDAGDGNAFKTNITSFLGREPTFEETKSFAEERWDAIKNLPNSNYSIVNDYNGYVVIMDNGG